MHRILNPILFSLILCGLVASTNNVNGQGKEETKPAKPEKKDKKDDTSAKTELPRFKTLTVNITKTKRVFDLTYDAEVKDDAPVKPVLAAMRKVYAPQGLKDDGDEAKADAKDAKLWKASHVLDREKRKKGEAVTGSMKHIKVESADDTKTTYLVTIAGQKPRKEFLQVITDSLKEYEGTVRGKGFTVKDATMEDAAKPGIEETRATGKLLGKTVTVTLEKVEKKD